MPQACSQDLSQQLVLVAAVLVGVLNWSAVAGRNGAAAAVTSCDDLSVLVQAQLPGTLSDHT